jgi:hypothetical protein
MHIIGGSGDLQAYATMTPDGRPSPHTTLNSHRGVYCIGPAGDNVTPKEFIQIHFAADASQTKLNRPIDPQPLSAVSEFGNQPRS